MKSKLYKSLSILLLTNLLVGCANQLTPQGEAKAQEPKPVVAAKKTDTFISKKQEVIYKTLVAEIARQRGQHEIAAEYFTEIAEQSTNVRLAENATKEALYAQDYDTAVNAAQLWVKLAPEDLNARQILWRTLLHQGKADEALPHLEFLLDHIKNDTEQYLERITILLEQYENIDNVLELMEKLVAKRQNDSTIQMVYARLLANADQTATALQILEQLLKKEPSHSQGVLLYAHILDKRGESEYALQWMQKELAKKPDNYDWRLWYARALADTSQYDAAIKQFQLLLTKYPHQLEVLFALGVLFLQIDQPQAAKHYFVMLLNKGGQPETAYYYLGQVAEADKSYAEAIEWYNKVTEGSNYLQAQARIARVLVGQGQFDKAVEHLRSVPTNNKKEAYALLQVEAELFAEQKRYTEAMKLYDDALESDLDNSDLLYLRAMLAEKMERLDWLERDLRRILELEPQNVQALNALGYTLADRTNRYQEAYELVKQALTLSPNEYYILDSIGWVLYRLGQYDEAIEYLRKAQAKQSDPEIATHLGEVLWVKGEHEAAKKVWEEALKEFPDDAQLREVMQRFMP